MSARDTERQDAGKAAHGALRALTRRDHEKTDAAFAGYDLGEPDSYGAFLAAHARVLPALEADLAPGTWLPGWVGRTKALLSDLAAMNVSMPQRIDIELPAGLGSRWGALYVLEGSRLGGAVLSKQVGGGFPAAYLSATHGPGGWQRVLRAIEDAAEGPAWIDEAVVGAKAVFAAYACAAGASLSHG